MESVWRMKEPDAAQRQEERFQPMANGGAALRSRAGNALTPGDVVRGKPLR